MTAVTLSIYLGYRLDHESCHRPEKKQDPVDLVVAVGRPGHCGRSSTSATQPSADAGNNIGPAAHLNASRTDTQYTEDKDPENQCRH